MPAGNTEKRRHKTLEILKNIKEQFEVENGWMIRKYKQRRQSTIDGYCMSGGIGGELFMSSLTRSHDGLQTPLFEIHHVNMLSNY